jgi:uncharacterized protein DUF4339
MQDATWRYRSGDQEIGPLTTEELCHAFASGKLPLDTKVYCAAAGRWVSARMIPGFRNAAVSAPASVQSSGSPAGASLSFAPGVEGEADDYTGTGNSYWYAAQFSGAVPVTVFLIALAAIFTGAGPRFVQSMNPLIAGAIGLSIIPAFFAGIYALFGVGKTKRRGVLFPAVFGVIFNGIFLLAAGSKIMFAQASYARFVREGIPSLTDYPGWVGAAKLPEGFIAVGSFDDDSPAAKLVSDQLGSQYTVIDIGVDNRRGSYSIEVNPSSVLIRTPQGSVRALDLDTALKSSPNAETLLQEWSGRHAVRPGEGHEFLCLIPHGVDLHSAYQVDLVVNGVTVSVPGRFMSAGERKALYDQGRKMQMASTDG